MRALLLRRFCWSQPFFADRAKYFSSLGEEVTVFFPKRESWADKEVKERIMTVNKELMASGHALALYNGMARFLEEKNASLQDGNEREFYDAYADPISDLLLSHVLKFSVQCPVMALQVLPIQLQQNLTSLFIKAS